MIEVRQILEQSYRLNDSKRPSGFGFGNEATVCCKTDGESETQRASWLLLIRLFQAKLSGFASDGHDPSPGSLRSPPSPHGRGQTSPKTALSHQGERVVAVDDQVRGLLLRTLPENQSPGVVLKQPEKQKLASAKVVTSYRTPNRSLNDGKRNRAVRSGGISCRVGLASPAKWCCQRGARYNAKQSVSTSK